MSAEEISSVQLSCSATSDIDLRQCGHSQAHGSLPSLDGYRRHSDICRLGSNVLMPYARYPGHRKARSQLLNAERLVLNIEATKKLVEKLQERKNCFRAILVTSRPNAAIVRPNSECLSSSSLFADRSTKRPLMLLKSETKGRLGGATPVRVEETDLATIPRPIERLLTLDRRVL